MKRNKFDRIEYTARAAAVVLRHADRKAGPCAVVTGDGQMTMLESSNAEALFMARMFVHAAIETRAIVYGGSYHFKRKAVKQ